jgi:hypothetical protein
VAFAPDGHTLATAREDQTVLLRDVSDLNIVQAHPTRRACSLTGHGMDSDQWARYVPGLAYRDTCAN